MRRRIEDIIVQIEWFKWRYGETHTKLKANPVHPLQKKTIQIMNQ